MLDSYDMVNNAHRSVPLGLRSGDLRLELGTRTLQPGSGFVLYTDGLTEGRAARRVPAMPVALFGEQRVRDILTAHRNAAPTDVVHALSTAVKDFAGGALADDVCVVACRLTSDPGRPPREERHISAIPAMRDP